VEDRESKVLKDCREAGSAEIKININGYCSPIHLCTIGSRCQITTIAEL